MHILILGATGRTGVFGYKYALEHGHHVTALVRNAKALKPRANLTIVEGDVLSESDVKKAFNASGKTVDAALSFLNPRRTSDLPWARFIGPKGLMPDTTRLLAQALRSQSAPPLQKPRLVIMNALGAGASYAVAPWIFRFLVTYTNLKTAYDDHNAVIHGIDEWCGNEVDWIVPLPVGLGDAGLKPIKTFREDESGASWMVTRESCARWMVDVAVGDLGGEFDNKCVIVSN